jgi:hypothetical protein
MLACEEWSHAFKAVRVRPGVLAIASKERALGSGERMSAAATAWQAAQTPSA